ncbi:hypothetical protein [Methanosarcina siciliae]|uniref:hypothetical protein n=1 Tax=Methanosarcina siciliae TaxID=38027 RepID=UPI0011E5A643|nr:hypothetical protein [Methanosarcina siciliae]
MPIGVPGSLSESEPCPGFCIDCGPSVEEALFLKYSTDGPIIECGVCELVQLVVHQVSFLKGIGYEDKIRCN